MGWKKTFNKKVCRKLEGSLWVDSENWGCKSLGVLSPFHQPYPSDHCKHESLHHHHHQAGNLIGLWEQPSGGERPCRDKSLAGLGSRERATTQFTAVTWKKLHAAFCFVLGTFCFVLFSASQRVDVSSLPRDWTSASCSGSTLERTTGLPGKSQDLYKWSKKGNKFQY